MGRDDVGQIMFRCPNCDAESPTGMAMDASSYDLSSWEGAPSNCRSCGTPVSLSRQITYLSSDH